MAKRFVLRSAQGIVVAVLTAMTSIAMADSAWAADDLTDVVHNITQWVMRLLVSVSVLFVMLAGLRYVLAGGDPGQIERAKSALRSATIGFVLAALAPIIVATLSSWVS